MKQIFIFLAGLLLLTACTNQTSDISSASHLPVADEFKAFYDAFGGRRVFGETITQGFPLETLMVQYFQNIRLEYDTTQPPAQRIHIAPLGQWAFDGLTEVIPVPLPENSPELAFAETDFTVQGEFRAFYETYRGEQLLGLPISPQLDEGGVRVQYFVNGRLEWQPQLPLEQRVQLGVLGQAHFDTEMAFYYEQFRDAQPVAAAGVTTVEIVASVQSPVVYVGEAQRLYVTVYTPQGEPVADIDVQVTVAHDDQIEVIDLGQTDGAGKITQLLPLDHIAPGQDVALQVSVYASTGQEIETFPLSFRMWW